MGDALLLLATSTFHPPTELPVMVAVVLLLVCYFYRVKVVSSNNNAYLRLVVVVGVEELYFVFPLLKLGVVVVVESKKSKIDLLYCKRLKKE